MKLSFDPMYQPYASNRYCVTARNGMVCTGSNLATNAGLEVLKKGGNAVDAAVAAASCLTVVEPSCNGIGSDTFAIIWMDGKMYGLNSSGYSPRAISIDRVKPLSADGKMPVYGWTPVTVPGAPMAWARLNERFGRLSLEEDMEGAIAYAREGWPLSPAIADSFEKATKRYTELFRGKHEYDEWFRVFTRGGESYHFGDILRLPDHARTLELIAKSGAGEFYRGEIARAIASQSARDGGFIAYEDLADYEAKWVEPIGVDYRGYRVWELPPNGQGITALMALNILRNFEFTDPNDPVTYHRQFEAMKLAFADSRHYVTDPDLMPIDAKRLILPEYGRERARLITDTAQVPTFGEPPTSGTVYLCTADGMGNMVSLIQSNYMGFGSGIVAEGYGVSLQNRGADFSLDPAHYNCLLPRKRTYHTIIPGFMTKDGDPVGPFGVMGGYMQPQGHVQVAMNYIDFGMNPQMALDRPRWQWMKDKRFTVEPRFDENAVNALRGMGHEVEYSNVISSFGRGQMIVKLDNGVLVGGCDSRTDSNIACY